MIVADTNVLSELSRIAPDQNVDAWADGQRGGGLVTTSITIAEIRYGLTRLPQGRRKRPLHSAMEGTLASFADRILPFEEADAEAYGRLVSDRERVGQPMATFDALIAAICLRHGATLATRNVMHFAGTGVELVNPWEWQPA